MKSFSLSKQHIVFGGVLIFLTVLALGFQALAPSLIRGTFEAGQKSLLNQLAESPDANAPLDFYLGRIEDKWTGPLSNVMLHLLFAFFCFGFAAQWPLKKYVFFVFGFLVLTRANILFYPPYGDAIGGPFAEAIWLKDHHFNYVELFRQPTYNLGGPKVYFFSLYPTYLAVLYKIIPSIKAFLVVNHLLVFFMSAVIVGLVREIANKMFEAKTALLSSIVLLALPLFQSQAEAINMEMPCLFFSVLAVHSLTCKRVGRAAWFAFFSLFVKGHGVLVCGTVFVVSLWLLVFDSTFQEKRKALVVSLAMVVIPIVKVLSKYLLHDQHVSAGMVSFLAGWPSLKIMTLPWVYGGSLAVFVFFLLWKRKFSKGRSEENVYVSAVIFLAAAMWFILFLNFYAVSPRYKLALAPYLVLCVIIAALSLSFLRKKSLWLLWGAIAAVAWGSYGFYHFPLGASYHIFLERSLEYRNDLTFNQKLVSRLEEKYKPYAIGAPFLVAQMLALPELGYVQDPFDVVVYGMPIQYKGIKNFEGFSKGDIMKTVWIGLAMDYRPQGGFPYPVHPTDKVLEKVVWGDSWAEIFMGGFSIEQRRRILQYVQDRAKLKGKK